MSAYLGFHNACKKRKVIARIDKNLEHRITQEKFRIKINA